MFRHFSYNAQYMQLFNNVLENNSLCRKQFYLYWNLYNPEDCLGSKPFNQSVYPCSKPCSICSIVGLIFDRLDLLLNATFVLY